MRVFLRELRWSFRSLRRSPSLAATGVLVLALAIGSTVAVYTIARPILIADLPLPDSERLVLVRRTIGDETTSAHSPADLADLRERTEIFSRVSGSSRFRALLEGAGETSFVQGASVTPDYLETLRAEPRFGTIFRAGPGGSVEEPEVVVLSSGFWRSRFGGDEGVLGRRIRLDDQAYRVIGVMPEALEFLGVELWVPGPNGLPRAPFPLGPEMVARRDMAYLSILGRLAPDLSLESGRQAVAAAGEEIETAYPAGYPDVGFSVEPLKAVVTAEAAELLGTLGRAVGLVLVLACLAVSGLLVGRFIEREREDGIRRAVGATRLHTSLASFADSLLLAGGGGILGGGLAFVGVRLLLSQAPPLPRTEAVVIDLHVLAFVVVVVLGVSVLAGLLPSLWRSAASMGSWFRPSAALGLEKGVRRTWSGLLVVEIGFTVVLLVGAGLAAHRLLELQRVDLGFDPEGWTTASVVLPSHRYPDPAGQAAFFDQLLAELASSAGPGAAAVTPAPLDGGRIGTSVTRAGDRRPPEEAAFSIALSSVSADYFRALGIPVLSGRTFKSGDLAGAPPVAVISRGAAERFWSGEEPLGTELVTGDGTVLRVVGVVDDVRHDLLDPEIQSPRLYRPFLQNPWPGMSVLLPAVGQDGEPGARLREAVDALDPGVPVSGVETLDARLSQVRRPSRYLLLVLGGFAALAVIIAAVGLASLVMSRIRTEERALALRLALGAPRSRLVARQLVQGLGVALAGVTLGTLGLLLPSGLVDRLWPDQRVGAGLVVLVGCVSLGVASLATLLPALRLYSLDPARAFRASHDGG